jgi:hypothetical protein
MIDERRGAISRISFQGGRERCDFLGSGLKRAVEAGLNSD